MKNESNGHAPYFIERRKANSKPKIDRRSLRKLNGANNPNARFTWKEIETIRKTDKTLKRYGHLTILANKYKTSRDVIWKIITGKSYLKKYKKEASINALISEWVGI